MLSVDMCLCNDAGAASDDDDDDDDDDDVSVFSLSLLIQCQSLYTQRSRRQPLLFW